MKFYDLKCHPLHFKFCEKKRQLFLSTLAYSKVDFLTVEKRSIKWLVWDGTSHPRVWMVWTELGLKAGFSNTKILLSYHPRSPLSGQNLGIFNLPFLLSTNLFTFLRWALSFLGSQAKLDDVHPRVITSEKGFCCLKKQYVNKWK